MDFMQLSPDNKNNRYQFLELSKGANKDLFKKFIQQEEVKNFPLCRNLLRANDIRNELGKGYFLYVIYDNIEDKFLAFSIVSDHRNHLEINIICAERGVGAILLNHIKNIAIKGGKKILKLISIQNEETFNFYIKNGFFIDTKVYSLYQDYREPRDFIHIMDYKNGPIYMDLIINYNDMIYDNENGLEVIRSKVIALNKVANMKFESKNNYDNNRRR
jgi:hypothetical protein